MTHEQTHRQEHIKEPQTDLEKLRNLKQGEFWVKRTSGQFEKGWSVVALINDGHDKIVVRLMNNAGDSKSPSGAKVLEWQTTAPEESEKTEQPAESARRDGEQVLRTAMTEYDENGLIVMPNWLKGDAESSKVPSSTSDKISSEAVKRSELWDRIDYPGPNAVSTSPNDAEPAVNMPTEIVEHPVESPAVTPEADTRADLNKSLDFLQKNISLSRLPYADGGVSTNYLAITAKVVAEKFGDVDPAQKIISIADAIKRQGHSDSGQILAIEDYIEELRRLV